MTDPSFSIPHIEKDIHWLVQELGPRPAYSSEARLGALGIRDRLKDAGWEPKVAQLANNIVACKGNGQTLFLAHSDSVADSPGAIDNAVGVAALLELARSTEATNLCLGFPAQEELGLVGSRHMAAILEEWHPSPKDLKVVIALDLVGQGDLSVTGLSQDWGVSELNWLSTKGDISFEYGYQVVSRILPSYERSDHRSFAEKGYLSAHLLGRNQDGIFPEYHLSSDTEYDVAHIENLMLVLETIATSEPPEQSPEWQSGLVLGKQVLPFWLIWLVCLAAIVSGAKNFISLKVHSLNFLKIIGIWLTWGLLSNIPLWLGIFTPSIEETNALSITGLPANGWWHWSSIYLLVFLVALKIGQSFPRINASHFWKGSSTFWGGIFTLGLFIIDPVLAFPVAIATLFSLRFSFLLALGGAYWLSGGILREVAFWGVLPPYFWFIPTLLLIPAIFMNDDSSSQ
jgi:hypothetical protein